MGRSMFLAVVSRLLGERELRHTAVEGDVRVREYLRVATCECI